MNESNYHSLCRDFMESFHHPWNQSKLSLDEWMMRNQHLLTTPERDIGCSLIIIGQTDFDCIYDVDIGWKFHEHVGDNASIRKFLTQQLEIVIVALKSELSDDLRIWIEEDFSGCTDFIKFEYTSSTGNIDLARDIIEGALESVPFHESLYLVVAPQVD